jgi:hypothetical protein
MPKAKLEEMEQEAIVPAAPAQTLPASVTPASAEDRRTAALVASTVAATLQQMGMASGAQDPLGAEARRIAELAMTVLDGCGVQLDGKVIELHDGGMVSDMMTVRAYEELQKAAGRVGVTQEEVAAKVADAFAEHEAEVRRQTGEAGIHLGPRGDAIMGPEDGDRKGVFK